MLASLLVDYIALLIDFNLVLAAVIFIIPVGGIIFGLIIGECAKVGMTMDNQVFCKWHGLVVAICGLLTCAAATYLDYATYYVSPAGELSRFFKGNHISEISDFDFVTYFKYVYLNGSMTLRFKGGVEIPIESAAYVTIIFLLQFIAAAIVSAIILSTIRNKPMCSTCGKYYKVKEVDRFIAERSLDDIMNDVYQELSEERFYTPHYLKSSNHAHSVKVYYCKNCRHGFISVFRLVKVGKNMQHQLMGSYNIGEVELFKFQLVD